MAEEITFRKFLEFLEEDIPFWDTTTEALIPRNTAVRAQVIAKQRGVVACVEDVAHFLRKLGLEVKELTRDGETVDRGSPVLEVIGDARTVLAVERTILNILMHCSGVATEVRKLVEIVKRVNPRVRVAATRKTLPGLRYFEKKAVAVGGGDTHRLSLSDAILIKDNHIRIVGGVEEAVKLAKARASFAHKVEVEVSTVDEAVKAAEAGADIVMLDNMPPQEVAKVVDELRRRGLREKVVIEVSGGITAENIAEYAKLDVDVISCGYITLSAKALDMSLEVVEVIRR